VNKGLGENIDAFEMQCYRRCMRISYTEYVTNNEVLRRVEQDRDCWVSSPGAQGGPVCNHMSPNFDSVGDP